MAGWERRNKDPRYSRKRWRELRASILRQSTICALCGHGGAGSVDHIKPAELLTGDEFYDPLGLHPMHGTRSKCSICAAASGGAIQGDCQSIKSALPIEQAQQRLFRRTGLAFGQVGPGRGAAAHSGPETSPVAGGTDDEDACAYSDVRAAYRDLCNPDRSLAREDALYIVTHIEDLGCKCGPADGLSFPCRNGCFDLAIEWAG